MSRTATCVWHDRRPTLVLALDEHLGLPVDSYVNGTQTWLTDDGPASSTLEWRLHPSPGTACPAGLSHYDLWEQVVAALSAGARSRRRSRSAPSTARLRSLWDGLECYVPYGDDLEPAPLAQAATHASSAAPPDAVGLVDHERIGAAWEQANGSDVDRRDAARRAHAVRPH